MPPKPKQLPFPLRHDLARFQTHHGDRWPEALIEAHEGRTPAGGFGGDSARHNSVIRSSLRLLRNHVTPDPSETPDLREKGAS